jgi:HEAT repeat protein
LAKEKADGQVSEKEVQSNNQNVNSRSETSADGELGDLINALKDKDAEVRLKAAQNLGEINNSDAVAPLIEALIDENWHVRQKIAWALGKIGDPRGNDQLSYLSVKDVDNDVREEAKKALQKRTFGGNTVDMRSATPIIKALTDQDADVQVRAAQSLGQINDTIAVDPLIQALNDEDWKVRQMAVWALGEIGDVRAIEPLSYLSVKDADNDVQVEAKKALGKLG